MIYNIEDDLLWNDFISGSEKAFIGLYDKYVHILYAYGLRYTIEKDLLKDCIQDTFTKLYHDRCKLKHVDNVNSYLRITFKNNLINVLKRDQVHLRYIQSSVAPDADNANAEILMINKEDDLDARRKIEIIMSMLSTRQKEVIYYRFVENKSIEEISKLMDINYQSVQNIIQRSIKKAKNYFFGKK